MTRIIAFLFAIGIILSNSQITFATEGHGNDQNDSEMHDSSSNGHEESEDQPKSDEVEETDDHGTMEEEHKEMEESHKEMEKTHDEMEETHEKLGDSHAEKEDDHSNQEDSHSSADTGSGHEEETDGGHGGPVVEVPPNYKVLGSFGAVNLAFILIGIWNKWIKRKGV